MADRIVYLVNKITNKLNPNLEWVDDASLSALMAQGFEQVSAMERKVGSTKTVMIVLRPSDENRGMTRREPELENMDLPDQFGNSRQVSIMQAVAQTNRDIALAIQGMGAAGHLGGARNHSMPGVSIISGELVGKAFDLGQTAAKRGLPEGECPFPVNSAPFVKWMQGYRSATGSGGVEVSARAREDAFMNGLNTARSLGQSDRVTCPFPPGSPLRDYWLEGFTRGGGRIV